MDLKNKITTRLNNKLIKNVSFYGNYNSIFLFVSAFSLNVNSLLKLLSPCPPTLSEYYLLQIDRSLIFQKNILLRISVLGMQIVDNILAQKKFKKIRLTDLSLAYSQFSNIRPFVIIADYIPSVPQLDSLQFATILGPKFTSDSIFFRISIST